MGVPDDVALGAVRLSLGHDTTADDVDRAARALVSAFRLAAPAPAAGG
jgi:cysteine sulfinate desulfinase/cysteine desulfurase-like protein